MTTPMDVIKTRVMLAESTWETSKRSLWKMHTNIASEIISERGVSGFVSIHCTHDSHYLFC